MILTDLLFPVLYSHELTGFQVSRVLSFIRGCLIKNLRDFDSHYVPFQTDFSSFSRAVDLLAFPLNRHSIFSVFFHLLRKLLSCSLLVKLLKYTFANDLLNIPHLQLSICSSGSPKRHFPYQLATISDPYFPQVFLERAAIEDTRIETDWVRWLF